MPHDRAYVGGWPGPDLAALGNRAWTTCTCHKTAEVGAADRGAGAEVRYLPAYKPDLTRSSGVLEAQAWLRSAKADGRRVIRAMGGGGRAADDPAG